MTLHQSVMKELCERLVEFEAPTYGKVVIAVELNYTEGQLATYEVAAYPREKFKRI